MGTTYNIVLLTVVALVLGSEAVALSIQMINIMKNIYSYRLTESLWRNIKSAPR